MADVFDLYVKDNRTIQFKFTEPIMLEDSHVTDWVFHIPRILNNLDVSGWAWWLVYINARGQKYSELLTLSEDPESPLDKCIATYTVDYSMSIRAGVVRFSLEAINTDTGGEILNEWHTQTYQAKVQDTLQGNQVEFAETESDIISALIIEVQNKVAQLTGGATPEPVSLIADMTDTKKVYLYVGSETGESTNYWYYYNGSAWVAGGLYASGITIDAVPTQGSANAVRSGGVWNALAGKVDAETGKGLSTNDYSDAEKQKVTDATADLTAMTTATVEDVGNVLKAKTVSDGKVIEWEFGETGENAIDAINAIIDSSEIVSDFDSVTAVNATYYGGRVRSWNNIASRVITTKTLIFPVDVKISASDDYSFAIHDLYIAYEFSGDQAAPGTRLSDEWTKTFTIPKNTNFIVVLSKGGSHNLAITPEDLHTGLSLKMYPSDLTILTNKVDTLVKDYTYTVEGEYINTQRQGYNAERLAFNQPSASGATQGMAIYNGVIFQCYADGSCKLVDLDTGTLVNTFALGAGHAGSVSFSSEFYEETDEFPLLYISDFDLQITTYVFRVSRTEFTLLKTYAVPTDVAGYQGFSCVNKSDGTMWTMGNTIASYVSGTKFILANWDLITATEQDGVYTPTLIKKSEIPWHQYSQFLQCFNNQIFTGFGARDSSKPASYTDTVFWVIDCGTMCIKSIITDLPEHIRSSEIEGCDFVPNGKKYDMITTQRSTDGYYRLSFE